MVFAVNNRTIEIYSTGEGATRLVITNCVQGEGASIWSECLEQGATNFTLAAINDLDWNNDLSPWEAPALFKKEPPFAGSASSYLSELIDSIIPQIFDKLDIKPERIILAGYSMAGLFSLYSAYNADIFDGIVTASGSLWFPAFVDYAETHRVSSAVKRVYFSVGNKEALTRNQVMQTVEDNTRKICALLESQGLDTIFELNEGGHFQDPDKRLARGIAWMLG